jgi:hypothetical protein
MELWFSSLSLSDTHRVLSWASQGKWPPFPPDIILVEAILHLPYLSLLPCDGTYLHCSRPLPSPPYSSPHVPPAPSHISLIPPAWHSRKPPLLPWRHTNDIPLNSGRWRTAPAHLAFPILSSFSPGLSS